MTLILIIAIIWGASALARATKEAARQKEIERQRREQAARSAELARMTAEWKQRQAEAKIETQRLIALEREQMRLAKEQEKQEAVLAKHEKRLADLEERMAIAEGEIEFQSQQIERLRAHIEHAETERDACVFGSTNYYKWDKKCMTLEKQIHTAEVKMAKAQYTKTSAAKELAA